MAQMSRNWRTLRSDLNEDWQLVRRKFKIFQMKYYKKYFLEKILNIRDKNRFGTYR